MRNIDKRETELLIENGVLVADTLRHLADNEIDSDYFAICHANENGTEIECELAITDYARQAAGTVDELVKALEAAEKRIAELEAREVKPVAWRCDSGSIANRRVVTVSEFVADSWAEKGMDVSPLYTAPPAPASVPDEMDLLTCHLDGVTETYAEDWNDCRAAILQGAENAETPTTMQTAPALDSSPKIAESPSGNSPVIPDGWVMLPAEPTQAMMNAWLSEVANWRGHAAGYRAMIAAAPQQEVK